MERTMTEEEHKLWNRFKDLKDITVVDHLIKLYERTNELHKIEFIARELVIQTDYFEAEMKARMALSRILIDKYYNR
jgi:hypothetical protein